MAFQVGRHSPIIDYFEKCRPDLKEKIIPKQIDLLRDMSNVKVTRQVVSCGRGFSKSMCAGLTGLFFADEYSTKIGKPLTVIIVSSQDALYSNIAEFFRWRPELKQRLVTVPSNLNEIPQKGIQFKDNYSKLIPRMATIHSVEGSRADIIIFDESQDIPEGVFDKGLGCVRDDTIGKIIVMGTPYTEVKGKGAKPNWFIKLVEDPKDFVKGFKFHLSQYSSELCDWNPHEMWKARWSKQRYDAECLGIVTDKEERTEFPASNINDCCYDIGGTREGGSNKDGVANSVLEVGIDCGFHNTTYVLTEWRGETKIKILYIGWWKDKSIEDIAPEIGKLLTSHNPYMIKIDSRQGCNVPSYKQQISKYTNKSINPIDASHKESIVDSDGVERIDVVKNIMIGQLGRHLREHHIIIPTRILWANQLIEQLKKYNRKRGINDDLVDGLMIACYRPNTPLNNGQHGRVGGFQLKPMSSFYWRNPRC
jgi:hypothetical protein